MVDWPALVGATLLFMTGAVSFCALSLGVIFWRTRKID
jgi:hypothetical protein